MPAHADTAIFLGWSGMVWFVYLQLTQEKRRVNMELFLHCIYTIGLYTV